MFRPAVALLALATVTSTALGVNYHVTELNVPNAALGSFFDLNNRGQAAGQVSVNGQFQAAVVSAGGIQLLSPPPGPGSAAAGINDAGAVVLEGIAGTTSFSYLFQNGTYTPLPTSNGRTFFPEGITNDGRIPGTFIGANSQAAILQNGAVMPLSVSPSNTIVMNARGDVLAQGTFTPGELSESFIYTTGGQVVPLPTQLNGRDVFYSALSNAGIAGGATLPLVGQQPGVPPGPPDINNSERPFIVVNGQLVEIPVQYFNMQVLAISQAGTVYGAGNLPDATPVVWVYRNGVLSPFNDTLDAPVTLTRISAVNELDELLAFGTDAGGNADFFLLTPTDSGAPGVPEPATLALLPLALAGLAVRRRIGA